MSPKSCASVTHVVQRQVLYLGEINASQREAWRKTIELQDAGTRRQVALFPAGSMPVDEVDSIGVRLSELSLRRPRQWGACWLALQLWQQLELDSFWRPRLARAQGSTPWLKALKTLVVYRLSDPGSEWRLHRQWFDSSAMADRLDSDFALAEKNTLYRCLDRLVEHKDDLFKFLVRRWGELFGAKFDVLLYDLTSTYFETDEDRGPDDLRQFGYSRDKRGDCRQVVIALIVTPEGFPLSYEVMGGGTADCTTLSGFLDRIEHRYGRANRIWVMDRGIPTEDSLAKMRSIGASYLVGTPKGRLTKLEQAFLSRPWAKARDGVQVKRLATDEDVYVLAQSDARIDKERRHAAQAAAPLHRALEGAARPEPDARPVADEARRCQARRRPCSGPGCSSMPGCSTRLQTAQGRRRGQWLGAAHGRLHHQIAAQHVVVAHVGPVQAQTVDTLRQQAVIAVLDTGAAAVVAQRQGRRTGQTKTLIDLLEQQHAAVADDVATVECGLDDTPANPSKLDSLIGTLWHRRSSVFIGVRYL